MSAPMAGGTAPASSPAEQPATADKPAGALVPTFDVVRVERTGDAVIAGRAAPGSDVALMDGDTVIAHGRADASGQFAFVPPKLADGSHDLSLQTRREGEAPIRSAQEVAISVAPNGTTKPLVALLSPDKPVEVLSDGAAPPAEAPKGTGTPGDAAKAAGANPAAVAAAAPVAIQSVQAGQNGNFLAAGVAHPGSQCRVYLNGAYLADVTAGQDGKWSVEIKKGMQPGRYTVRADELGPSGTVSHRAEVPFEYPEAVAGGQTQGRAKRLLLGRLAPRSMPNDGSPSGPDSVAGSVASGVAPKSSAMAAIDSGAQVTDGNSTGKLPASRGGSSATLTQSVAPPSAAAAVIADLHTTTVIHGDSLWRISRKMLGHGIQYTEIYASNTSQIRDPALIYPGQIFVVPSKRPNG